MRVEGWRVEGFGILSGVEERGVPPGLTVVLGPNESGKSTLMHFLAGLLVGFPDARRRGPRHDPVNGGRHGGAVFLVDGEGHRVVVERFAGERSPRVTAPGGDPAIAAACTRLLAGVDPTVFRSVFAFGLDELQSLGALAGGGELNELLFSAGVTGAGRSATAALRALGDERSKIVRPRADHGRANQALLHLEVLDGQLRAAREEARRYPSLRDEVDTLAGEVEAARAAVEGTDDEPAGAGMGESGCPDRAGASATRPRLSPLPRLRRLAPLALLLGVATGSCAAALAGSTIAAVACLLVLVAACVAWVVRATGTGRAGVVDVVRVVSQDGEPVGERATRLQRIPELAATYEAAVRAHQDRARLLAAIAGSDAVARLSLERAGLEDELRGELDEWWVLGLARSLVEETLAGYERERQPAVLRRAGELFGTVTGERYPHLVLRDERSGGRDQGVDVVDRSGRRLDARLLSRGTAEQLYLCLRLALAEVFAQRVARLPFLLDDVLVDFDPARAAAVAEVLHQVAERHQVLLFTCHPHLARLVTAGRGTAAVIELGTDETGNDAGSWSASSTTLLPAAALRARSGSVLR